MKHTIKTTLGAACAGIFVLASSAAQASLINRGGGLIYDTDLNVTWLADANYASTSGYDTDGLMTWANANTWAANLSYYDSVRGVTYDDWRLPTTLQPDPSCSSQSGSVSSGYNCTGSEMGHLFYTELGGVAGQSIVTTHNANYNLFANVVSGARWSATEYATFTDGAWYFNIYDNYQTASLKTSYNYAWAVRPGDVAAATSAVPVPAAALLFGSGLLGLIGVSRKRRG